MTNIMILKESKVSNNLFLKTSKLKEYALLSYIDKLDENVEYNISEFLEQFSLSFYDFRRLLSALEDKQILNQKLKETENLVLVVSFSTKQTTNSLNNKFGIDDSIFNNIVNVVSENNKIDYDSLQTHLYSYLTKNVVTNLNFEINSRDEYLYFLRNINPQDYITSTTNMQLTFSQFNFIYVMAYDYNFNTELINLAIDYTISQNIYNTFNYKYATKLMLNWYKNKIKTLDDGIEYIKLSKQRLEEKQNDNMFIEPTYEEEPIIEQTSNDIDIDSILNGAYNE